MADAIQLTPAQRNAAMLRVSESIALRSGAGCGKTFVLSMRFCELLTRPGGDAHARLERLVALTFTDKAALEMAQRVRSMLQERLGDASGPQRQQLLEWIDQMPSARISTIHSFCSAILRAHAIEAGIDPAFAVATDETLVARLVAESVDEAVLRAVEQERPEAAEVVLSLGFGRVCELVARLVETRTEWQPEAYTDAQELLNAWRESLLRERAAAWARLEADAALDAAVDELDKLLCASPEDALDVWRCEHLAVARAVLDAPEARTPESFAILRDTPGRAGADRNWGGKGSAKGVRDRLKDVMGQFEPYAVYAEELGDLDARAAETLAALTSLACDAKVLYARQKRRRGLLDFTDLLDLTAGLLAGNPELRRALGGQIDQLLIDECQDTDAFQVRLLVQLLLCDGRDEPPADGRLFVVGDGKQSIYRFRGAQVEVFESLCRSLGQGKEENLDLCFRTHAAGVGLVNHVFSELIGEGYTPIRAVRDVLPEGPSVEILVARGDDAGGDASDDDGDDAPAARMTAERATELQAALTAECIEAMLSDGGKRVWDRARGEYRPVRPGDVAILFGRMTKSLSYERELARRGIPYYVVGGTGFFRQQEVFDVLNALRAIDNPFDDIAFFGTLRSSLVGLDDNALARLAELVERPYLPQLAGRDVGEALGSAAGPLCEACELLMSLHAVKDALGVDELMRRLLDATAYEAVLLSQFQGRRMLGNVRMLMDQARQAASQRVGLGEFLDQAQDLVLREARYEQAAVAGEAEDVVRLMTTHKAKGLEFPVVIVPDLNAGFQSTRDALLNRPDWGLVYNLRPDPADGDADGDARPLSYLLAKAADDRDEQAEEIRRFYVAATRHEDHLVFIGCDWRDKDNLAFQRSGCLLSKLDEVLHVRAALDAGAETIAYRDNGRTFQAKVQAIEPCGADPRRGEEGEGERLLRASAGPEAFVAAIRASAPAGGGPVLVGPAPLAALRVESGVTAMADFATCGMLYRWRHELRLPERVLPQRAPGGGGAPSLEALLPDAAMAGTILHRCMERLDLSRAAAPQAGALLRQALSELEMDDAAADVLSDPLTGMLERFAHSTLYERLRHAGRLRRELDFVLDMDELRLRGQIDLLYQDADGVWRLVDWKSDRLVTPPAEHAEKYRMQMQLYAAAAERFGATPADATLYFLRTGEEVRMEFDSATLRAAQEDARDVGRRLLAARTTGDWPRCRDHCTRCGYQALCR